MNLIFIFIQILLAKYTSDCVRVIVRLRVWMSCITFRTHYSCFILRCLHSSFSYFPLICAFLTKRGQGKLKKISTHCLGNLLAVKRNVLKWRRNHSQNVIWREIVSFVPHWKWNFAFLVGQKIFPYQYTVLRFYLAYKKKIVTYTVKAQHMFHSHCVLFIDLLFNRMWWSLHVGMERDRTAGFVCQSWWHWWWQADSN